jgi:serine/threonine protein kinase
VRHCWCAAQKSGKKLGEGAFGVVYKGKWHGKGVAVKQVKAGVIGGEKAMAEFEAEVGNMAKVSFHENLVQLHGVTTLENGDLAAVVEFCANGASVAALYGDKARTDWTPDNCCALLTARRAAWRICTRQDMVHRDIAARNVLLTKHDEPKVADFGMARLVERRRTSSRPSIRSVRSSGWRPSRWSGARTRKRVDVFAFGVLLFEIFAARGAVDGRFKHHHGHQGDGRRAHGRFVAQDSARSRRS